MRVSRVIRRLPGTLPLMIVASAMVAGAQTSDTSEEFWPEFDFFIKLNEKSRIFAMYTATRQEALNSYSDGQTGIHIDFYALRARRLRLINHTDQARSRSLMLRAGYLISRPRNNSGTATEHMAIVEVTARAHLPAGLLLGDRNRFDFRWVGGDPRHRYRNRLKLERTFDVGRFQFTPYAHTELYYDLRQWSWSRFRYCAGAEWSLTKRIVLEGYFLRQNTWASTPQFVNAIGTAVQFYFR